MPGFTGTIYKMTKPPKGILRWFQLVEKVITQILPDLMTKGLGSSPFSKGLAESRGMSLDVLRTSGRLEFPSSRREFAATPYGGKKEISRKVRRTLEQMGEIPILRGDWTQSNSGQHMLP